MVFEGVKGGSRCESSVARNRNFLDVTDVSVPVTLHPAQLV